MIPSFFIGLREGLEAALIVFIALGVLEKIGHSSLRKVIWSGVIAALLVSLSVAIALQFVGATLEGKSEEVFEGVTMLLASGVLTWMIFWMLRNSRRLQAGLESDVRKAVQGGQKWALFSIAFLAVVREGIETSLFLTAAAMTASTRQVFAGGLIGIAVAFLLGWALFKTTIRLNIRNFFLVTSVLLILFAAGLFAHGIHEFIEVGWIPPVVDQVWDLNPYLSEDSLVGSMLKSVFGYNGNPSLVEALSYVGYFVVILLAVRLVTKGRSRLEKSQR
ncbi:MAG: hypothetical protein GTO14_15860 [Anaerolineales bacterium]|nr:hypothetical protein [Anaerolineales bacterium]